MLLGHVRRRAQHAATAGVAAAFVAFHVASHAEGLAAAAVRALERLLAGVRVAVDFEA